MALTKAQRAERRAAVAEALRRAWWRRDARGRRTRVELTLQQGRRRPTVSGTVRYVATSDAFVLIDDGLADPSTAQPLEPLHVPVDAIRSVRTL